jgi:hypothetical protein
MTLLIIWLISAVSVVALIIGCRRRGKTVDYFLREIGKHRLAPLLSQIAFLFVSVAGGIWGCSFAAELFRELDEGKAPVVVEGHLAGLRLLVGSRCALLLLGVFFAAAAFIALAGIRRALLALAATSKTRDPRVR